MKLLISFLLFITMPYIIYCAESEFFAKEIERLDALAASKTSINGVIMLKENGYLGDGGVGFVYEGMTSLNGNNFSVAVKFTTEDKKKYIRKEFEIYRYLEAYQNPLVERFGIPMVHHYGKWDEFTFIAISKFVGDLNDIRINKPLEHPLNVLIIFRNFVIQSKYMHSKGVRHDDIKPGNIMFRGHQTFLIDFNLSAKMAKYGKSGTMSYVSRRYHQGELRHAVDDWESFLYSMCSMLRVHLQWINAEYKDMEFRERSRLFGDLKDKTQDVRDSINAHIGSRKLKEIFKHFADEVYHESKTIPDYDRLESLISDTIMKYRDKNSPFPPTFTWLTDAEKEWAMKNPLPDIKRDIREPADIDFKSFKYAKPIRSEGESSGTKHDDEEHHHHTSPEKSVGCSLKKSLKLLKIFNRNK